MRPATLLLAVHGSFAGPALLAQPPVVDAGGRTFFGVTIGDSIPRSVFSAPCQPATQLALMGGRYHITTDDMLFRSPHEHSDSGAVLAALARVEVCASAWTGPSLLLAVAIDGRVTKIMASWQDSAQALVVYEGLRDTLQAHLGQPFELTDASARWRADSVMVELIRGRWWLPGAPQLYVSHGFGCDRYEELVHQREPRLNWTDAATKHCWHAPELRKGRDQPD